MNSPESPLKNINPEKNIEMIKKCLDIFKDVRLNYSDDLPEQKINFDDPKHNKYKCQTITWSFILNYSNILLELCPNISEDAKNIIYNFKNYYKTVDFTKRRTRKEIDLLNDYFDKIIPLLEKELI